MHVLKKKVQDFEEVEVKTKNTDGYTRAGVCNVEGAPKQEGYKRGNTGNNRGGKGGKTNKLNQEDFPALG